jgi:hypothetical protein
MLRCVVQYLLLNKDVVHKSATQEKLHAYSKAGSKKLLRKQKADQNKLTRFYFYYLMSFISE